MDVPSQISRHSRSKGIEEYSNSQELLSDVESLKNDNLNLLLKTEVFEKYLRKRCPSLLVVDRSVEPSLRTTFGSEQIPQRASFSLSLSTAPSDSSPSPSPSPSPSRLARTSHSLPHSSYSAPRISSVFMIDMVDRELDESRIAMDKLRRRFESAKFLLETEEENIKADIKLLEENKVTLTNFIKQNTDKKTGRVFHDKFVRFIESELQNSDRHLRKLKLKTRSVQIQYNRLLARHEQRIELKERLHPIDLNKLDIENEELRERFDQKTKVAMELKKTVGKKGQNLVAMKSKLNDVLLALRSIRHDIKQKETKYKFTEEKEIKNVNELITAEIINENMKQLNSSFKSPDAHNYLQVQVRLNELKSEKEVWERRCRYQRQSIMMLEHQLKQLVPSQAPKRKGVSTHSYRSSRSVFSSKSADSMLRHLSRASHAIPHCTPTTPSLRHW